MPRPQFSLKRLLWLVALVCAFLSGAVAGAKLQAMRYEIEIGPAISLYSDATPAPPGVRTNRLRHQIRPKYPWLDYLPGDPSKIRPSSVGPAYEPDE